MRQVQPILEEIRRVAAERRARLSIGSDEISAPPPVAHVDLRDPVVIPDGHPLRRVLAVADRWRARALEAILIRQSEFNRQVSSALAALATQAAHGERDREHLRDLRELCESLVERVEQLSDRMAHVDRRLRRMQASTAADRPDVPAAQAAAGPPPSEQAFGDLYRDPAYEQLGAALRGDRQIIRERQRRYLDVFAAAEGTVLDLACGRGEFLELMREVHRPARGVDVSPDIVQQCVEQGLDVVQGDALEYLNGLEEGSLGGLFCAQLLEHLEPTYLLALLRAAHAALRPGARIVVETINVDALAALPIFYADPSHVRPLPPSTTTLLLASCGFHQVELRYASEFPPLARLTASGEDSALARRFDEAVAKLNQTVWGPREYAVIATR